MVQVKDTCQDIEPVRQALIHHAAARDYLFHIIVSEDVPLNDRTLMLWGWFTRFDPLADLYPAKPDGHRQPVDFRFSHCH
jgi:3-polyprenyl-4-hydroxybenzoate decarboxylase